MFFFGEIFCYFLSCQTLSR
uniref:Uncharacterized protein n=1 Tax=Rhizophora mucronata TaxID=61149 RepID=A0A2P2JM72_RHIMU